MRLSVIGCGYLGAVHAACMAKLGHEVVGLEVDEAKAKALDSGVTPFHEPGFDELLGETLATGRLRFTTDPDAIADAQVHFICVGTPQQEGRYAADLRYVWSAVDTLIPRLRAHADGPTLVVGKSTVPVGTAEEIAARIAAEAPEANATLVWNPEFLREGFGIQDTLSPDRIVYGLPTRQGVTTPAGEAAAAVLDAVYADQLQRQQIPRLFTDYATAQLVKVAANSFLATKISFINEIANVSEETGADVTQVAKGMGLDDRIGPKFLQPGIGFGGSCFPKDVSALKQLAGNSGYHFQLLSAVIEVNELQKRRVVGKLKRAIGGLVGKRVALLGLAFKPNTDDMREASSLVLAGRLQGEGAQVVAYDPIAMEEAARLMHGVEFADSELEAVSGADAVVLVTEWPQFKELDW